MHTRSPFLSPTSCAHIMIDVQEKLLPKISSHTKLVKKLCILLQGLHTFNIPQIISEQYPAGLGPTYSELATCINTFAAPPLSFQKMTFSCVRHPPLAEILTQMTCTDWILSGIETHICVFQTAKDLLHLGKRVVIAVDATSSRSQVDRISAVEELRTLGARIASVETILFELLATAEAKEFKTISQLVK